MPQERDHRDFVQEQYRDSQNLNSRADLYRRFSTNRYGWFDWVFDRLELAENGSILELGCGHGLLWRKCIDRMDPSWTVTLSDLSYGMVAEAKHKLEPSCASTFRFVIIDAQMIPFEGDSFDLVIANHVLYHIPNRERALREVHRVLKPSGRFLAATVGENHNTEIRSLIHRFDPRLLERDRDVLFSFSLQNGRSELATIFETVKLDRYDESLVVTELDPLLDYVRSRVDTDLLSPQIDRFRTFLAQEFRRMNGSISISTETGMFLATA